MGRVAIAMVQWCGGWWWWLIIIILRIIEHGERESSSPCRCPHPTLSAREGRVKRQARQRIHSTSVEAFPRAPGLRGSTHFVSVKCLPIGLPHLPFPRSTHLVSYFGRNRTTNQMHSERIFPILRLFDSKNKTSVLKSRFLILIKKTLVLNFLGFLEIKRPGGHAVYRIFVIIKNFSNRTPPVGML